MSEADPIIELVSHLRRAIDARPDRKGTSFGAVRKGTSFGAVRTDADGDSEGLADLCVFDERGNPLLVVVTAQPSTATLASLDPYARSLVRRGLQAAFHVGAPLAATITDDRLVVFDARGPNGDRRVGADDFATTEAPILHRGSTAHAMDDLAAVADAFLDDAAGLLADEDPRPSQDDAFVDRVLGLHDALSDRLVAALPGALGTDREVDEENADSPAGVSARRQFAERVIGRVLVETLVTQLADTESDAVFEHAPDSESVSLDRLPDSMTIPVREFAGELDDLDELDLATFEGDVLGRVYERVIPERRRRDRGEYYTPSAVCDLVTRLTVTDPDDAVLDPASGSGSFLLSAADRLRSLREDPESASTPFADRLAGVELNRVPARLAAISLATEDPSVGPEGIAIDVEDFFDVEPGDFERSGSDSSVEGFDAIVGNPPYVRQEDVEDKDHVREHLDHEDVDATFLSRRSDLYVYFLTHATEFLADSGDLGFLTSDRWLDTRYGADLQRFLLDHFAIRAVVTFDRQVFDDALVDSSLLILRRERDARKRETNVATFLRVKAEMDVETIASIVERDHESDRLYSTDEYRLLTRTQSALRRETKWNVFFTAPAIYFDLVAAPTVVDLADVADVSYGVKTGANPFFVARLDEFEALGLEAYCSPLLKASGQVDAIRVTDDVADEWRVLDVHDLVVEALSETGDDAGEDVDEETTDSEALESRVKRWLAANDHDTLLEYVRSGEADGYHDRSSLSSRRVWFDLGDLPRPRILTTMFTWRVHRVYWNETGAATSDQFYYVDPGPAVDEEVLAGILNSRVVWLANELLGRRAGGAGMTRLQTKVYETERWPVPDPRELDDRRRDAIRSAFRALQEREFAVDEPTIEATEQERDALDRAVIPALGLKRDDEVVLQELKRGVRAMLAMRDEGAGERTSVLVERDRGDGEDVAEIDLPDPSEDTRRTD